MKSIICGLIKRYKWQLFVLFLLISLCTIIELFLPVMLQAYIDRISTMSNDSMINYFMIPAMYLLGSIFLQLFTFLKNLLCDSTAWHITDHLRQKLVQKILNSGCFFFKQYSEGNILETMENDINGIEDFFKDTLIPVIINILMIFGVVIVFFYQSIYLGSGIMVFLILSFILLYHVQKKDSLILNNDRDFSNNLSEFLNELICCHKEIKVFRKIDSVISHLDKFLILQKKIKIDVQKFLYGIWILTLTLLAAVNIMTFMIGGLLYYKNIISLGTIYLLYTYSNKMKTPLEEFQMYIQNMSKVRASLKRLTDLYFFDDGLKNGTFSVLDGKSYLITINNLTYSYLDSKSSVALNNISLTIRKGEVVGIFGNSGSGKSTLIKLLCKQIEPPEGTVFINDHDMNCISINCIRKAIGYISSKNSILEGTLKDNLTGFNASISDDELISLIRKYKLLEYFHFIDEISKEALHKPIGDYLSEGEKQTLAICRAVIQKKQMLILDEAESNIHIEDEHLFSLIKSMAQGRSIIIVTHNVERLRICDKIYVMKEGKIIEEGEIDELVHNKESLFSKFSGTLWE